MPAIMEAIGGIAFPVVFCDDESESEIGNVVVYPTTEFKRFQAVLSQKIGISPNQFSIFFSSPESRRRIPVTSKVNFSVISRETNCFFLVVLKRTKRDRRRRNSHLETASYYSPNQVKNPLENAVFLRGGAGINHGGLGLPYAGRVEWENRVRELQIEKERYLINMGLARASGFGWARAAVDTVEAEAWWCVRNVKELMRWGRRLGSTGALTTLL